MTHNPPKGLPFTVRYRGKMYSFAYDFPTKAKLEKFLSKNRAREKSVKQKDKVAHFFTAVKKFDVDGKTVYGVYWRAVYFKRPLRKKQAEERAKQAKKRR